MTGFWKRERKLLGHHKLLAFLEVGFGVRSTMADGYGFLDGDFDEEDVWAVVKERKDINTKFRKSSRDSPSVSAARHVPTAARMIPRSNNTITSTEGRLVQQSAPVNIPDWSKIYRKKAPESYGYRDGSWTGNHGGYGHHDVDDDNVNGGGDDEDDDDDDRIPPHEWIEKKLARSQISSFSMCEGAGRTLKGRDLSKVRNAVLTKTGFLE